MKHLKKIFTSKESVFKNKFINTLLILIAILLFYDKVTLNWSMAKSGSFVVSSMLGIFIIIAPFIFVFILVSLSTQYDQNYTYLGKESLKTKIKFGAKSIFALGASISLIFLLSIGAGKLTWLVAGGLQMEKDLTALKIICSPESSVNNILSVINEIRPCESCSDTTIVFNVGSGKTEGYKSNNYLSEVHRISQAKYVACMTTESDFKKCEYEGGQDKMILYEEKITTRVFSLISGEQKGEGFSLSADPPSCPYFLNTTNGVPIDFDQFIDISRDLVYESIEKMIH